MSSELHTLLDDGTPVGESGDGMTASAPIVTSPTVLATDRWTRRAGERIAAGWRETITQSSDVEDLASLDVICDPIIAADSIETLLSVSPTLAEHPEDAHRAKWWKQLIDAPESQALRSRTQANAALAEIAAAELAGQWARYVEEHPEPEPGEGDGDGDGEESAEDSVARIRSTRQALASAAEAADAAEAIGQGLGLGSGGTADAATLAKYTRRLRQSPRLSAIMRMAGRFIAKSARLQRERSNLPGMEITGVELSGDLARALPIEMALVAGVVPELEPLALLKLSERRTLSYKRISRTPKEMGPIVVSVDESGSMNGDRIAAAKGLALAMASIARAQKRPFMLVGWSDETDGEVNIVRDTDGPEAIVAWLEHFYNGGTDLRGPLWTVTTDAWPAGKIGAAADHIIITDDAVGVDTWLLDHYKTWAGCTNVRTFGIAIGVRKTETLAKFADGGVWAIPELNLESAPVDVVLSIGPSA